MAVPNDPTRTAASSLPDTIRRVGRLEIRARQIVEGFLSGMHRSPYFGRSLEFREHRQYAPGDDLRHVDWKVWARQDRYYVKQYEEDTNLRGTMLVDRSASMAYGEGPLNKYDYASTAATALAYLLLRQNDAAGCLAFDESITAATPLRSSRGHITMIADVLQSATSLRKTDLRRVVTEAAVSLPRRGVAVLISDLMGDLEGLRQGLGLLRQRGHDLLVLHVLHDDELDFPFDGATRFTGLETEAEITCNPRALRDDYLRAMERFLEASRAACLGQGADYLLTRTSESLDKVLTSFLSRRMNTSH